MTVRAAYSVNEVADLYGLSPKHIHKLVRDGTLARVPHTGRMTRISVVELERVFGPLPKEAVA